MPVRRKEPQRCLKSSKRGNIPAQVHEKLQVWSIPLAQLRSCTRRKVEIPYAVCDKSKGQPARQGLAMPANRKIHLSSQAYSLGPSLNQRLRKHKQFREYNQPALEMLTGNCDRRIWHRTRSRF